MKRGRRRFSLAGGKEEEVTAWEKKEKSGLRPFFELRIEEPIFLLPTWILDREREGEREYQSVPQIEIVQPYTVEYCLFFWKFDSGPAEHEFSGISFPLLLL